MSYSLPRFERSPQGYGEVFTQPSGRVEKCRFFTSSSKFSHLFTMTIRAELLRSQHRVSQVLTECFQTSPHRDPGAKFRDGTVPEVRGFDTSPRRETNFDACPVSGLDATGF